MFEHSWSEVDEPTPYWIPIRLPHCTHAGSRYTCFDGTCRLVLVHNIVLKHIGIDRIIETVIERLGEVEKVFLIGEFSKGLDSQIIDLIFIGNIDKAYLINLIEKVEKLINRKIRYLVYTQEELEQLDWEQFKPEPFLLWLRD